MAPKPKSIKSSKRKLDQGSSSSTPQMVSDSQIKQWLFKSSPSIKRYEELQKKKIHTGPFYNLLRFGDYEMDELCEAAGLKELVNFNSNNKEIDQLAILCFIQTWIAD